MSSDSVTFTGLSRHKRGSSGRSNFMTRPGRRRARTISVLDPGAPGWLAVISRPIEKRERKNGEERKCDKSEVRRDLREKLWKTSKALCRKTQIESSSDNPRRREVSADEQPLFAQLVRSANSETAWLKSRWLHR